MQAGLAYALLNSKGWRILVVVSTTPYVLLLVLLPFVPESPRFLLVKGRVAAAEQVLGKVLRVCGRDMPDGSLQPLLSTAGDGMPVSPAGTPDAGEQQPLGPASRNLHGEPVRCNGSWTCVC